MHKGLLYNELCRPIGCTCVHTIMQTNRKATSNNSLFFSRMYGIKYARGAAAPPAPQQIRLCMDQCHARNLTSEAPLFDIIASLADHHFTF